MLKKCEGDLRLKAIQAFCGAGLEGFDGFYLFSVIHHSWGRAVWRRSWEKHDKNIALLSWVLDKKILAIIFPDKKLRLYFESKLLKTSRRIYSAWDYPFNLSCWLQNGLRIVPCQNLVTNVGVGNEITHTNVDDGQASIPVSALPEDIKDPVVVTPNWRYDKAIMQRFHRFPIPAMRLAWKLKALRSWYLRSEAV